MSAPDSPPFAIPFETSFDGQIGVRPGVVTEDSAEATVEVRPELLSSAGAVPGGVYATIAEGITSGATAMAVMPAGRLAVGMSNDTTVTRQVSSGTLTARARRRHAGETEWVWDVQATDDDGNVSALSVVTIAVRPLPST